jgi:1-phosphofructokinase
VDVDEQRARARAGDPMSRVAIFGPSPLLNITIEERGAGVDDIHLHPAGQGVWVARMAGELGAHPVLCGFVGGEPGALLRPLLDALPGERRLVETAESSGCSIVDRRDGTRKVIATAWTRPPSRHELDDLFSSACAAALSSSALVVCNPWPGDVLPLELYRNLVSDARAGGIPVLVDLSSPRLDSALAGGPDVVKINDWELAEYVSGPVDGPRLRAAAERLLAAGARAAVITRGGEPGLAVTAERAWEIVPPRLERGYREGCGDSMMGAMAAAKATGAGLERMLVVGAAAGAACFLRHGLGSARRETIDELASRVELRAL